MSITKILNVSTHSRFFNLSRIFLWTTSGVLYKKKDNFPLRVRVIRCNIIFHRRTMLPGMMQSDGWFAETHHDQPEAISFARTKNYSGGSVSLAGLLFVIIIIRIISLQGLYEILFFLANNNNNNNTLHGTTLYKGEIINKKKRSKGITQRKTAVDRGCRMAFENFV